MICCLCISTRVKEDEKKYFSPADNVGTYFHMYFILRGNAVAQLVEALRYKPEGRGFDSLWSHWIFFSLT